MPRRMAVPSVPASRPGLTPAVRCRVLRPLFFLLVMIILCASVVVGGCGGRKKIDTPVASEPKPAASQPFPIATDPTVRPTVGPLLVRVGLGTGIADLQLTATGDAYLLLDEMRRRESRVSGGAALTLTRRGGGVAWYTGGHSGTAEVVVLQPVDPAYRGRAGNRLPGDGIDHTGEGIGPLYAHARLHHLSLGRQPRMIVGYDLKCFG